MPVLAEPSRRDAALTNAGPFGLAHLPIFDGVHEDVAGRVLPHFSGRQYRAGATIIAQGEKTEQVYVIQRGIVDLTRVEGHNECGVLLLSTNDVFMPAAALWGEPSLLAARALTALKVAVAPAEIVKSAAEQSSDFAFNLMKVMSGQWRMAVRNILNLNCRTAAQRVGAFLLHLADLQEDSGPPVLPIAKRHLAARLGIKPETLSRNLQIVADNGLQLRGRAIIIHDRHRTEQFCGPDPYPEKDERQLSVFAF